MLHGEPTTDDRYHLLLDSIDQGFCIVRMELDAQGHVVDYIFEEVNAAFEAQTGLKDAEGKRMRSLAPEHEQFWFDVYGQVALDGRPVRFTHQGKALGRWFDVNAFRVGGEGSLRVGILFRDITEGKSAETTLCNAMHEAKEANKAKSDFLANMSHEIRTPMNAIVGLSRILQKQSLTDKQQQFVDTLAHSADSMLSLINDLLDIAKIESQQVELERIPFSVEQVMRQVGDIASVKAREKNLALTLDTAAVRGKTYVGDPVRLQQVLLNLCSNAVKFTDTGSVHLAVTTRANGPDQEVLELAVRDTGGGIPQDKMARIFEKFTQADSSINRKYGGTGLGLAITKTLTEVMGGSIDVKSETGKGSCFTLSLPLALERRHADSGLDARDTDQASMNMSNIQRVLLVEDHPPNVLVARTLLEQFGYSCEIAVNGEEALSKAKAERFHAILMDVQMPGMDGFQTTAAIREHEQAHAAAPHVIIGMTAHALAGDRDRCIDSGMDDYLPKPVDAEILEEKLRALA